MSDHTISGQLIDLHQRRIYPVQLSIAEGKIVSITELDEAPGHYILPGFVDAHVHIESSMLTPAQFARMAVIHGSVATISDPHEIANVCGLEGVDWMIANAQQVPFKCFFGAPSCVPATVFETAGATIDAGAIDHLLSLPDIWYLAEMMNYPGVLHGDPEVLQKVAAAKRWNKPVDGHAPGLRGDAAKAYADAGITTDHECTTLDEALEKVAAGIQILIREGSAAKNFESLHPLLRLHPERVMLCSDDKHPDDLALGHINQLVKRALAKGYDLFDVLTAACINPVRHYGVPVGQLRIGDPADLIIVPDLVSWQPLEVYINGRIVAKDLDCLFDAPAAEPVNYFVAQPKNPDDFSVSAASGSNVKVIVAHEGQLVTSATTAVLPFSADGIQADISQDVLKLVVVNRYEQDAPPAIAFIQGFGFKQGAIASSVAHDCHNIIAVGVDDASICAAVNAIIDMQGGIAVARDTDAVNLLPLPIAGLMSDGDGFIVGKEYASLSNAAKELGSPLHAPFMTLSFMALLVIPSLKLSDKGLFDGERFAFTGLSQPF